MAANPQQRRIGRWTLVGLFALFIVPLLLAAAWYVYAPQYAPAPVTHGQLIDPARPLEPFRLMGADGDTFTREDLHGRWHLVQVVGAGCGSACRQRLHDTRQLHRALGKDHTRVRRWLVVPGDARLEDRARLREAHPQLRILHAGSDSRFSRQFPAERSSVDVFVIDPLGNLMMRFGPQADPERMLDDIEKLLELSQIG